MMMAICARSNLSMEKSSGKNSGNITDDMNSKLTCRIRAGAFREAFEHRHEIVRDIKRQAGYPIHRDLFDIVDGLAFAENTDEFATWWNIFVAWAKDNNVRVEAR